MVNFILCPRCLFLNLNLSDDELVQKPESEIQKSLSERWPSLVNNEMDDREKSCCFCLGMLRDLFLESCTKEISAAVQTEMYKCSNFKLMISQPVQLLLFSKHFDNQHHKVINAYRRSGNRLEVKDIMKIYLEPRLQENLSMKALAKGNAELEIVIVIKHDETEKNILPKLEIEVPKCFEKAKRINEHLEKKRRREDLTIFNQTTTNEALKSLTSEQLSNMVTGKHHLHSARLDKVSATRMPVFLAGRYCKYSRDLSQTPWLLEGKRKSETSVEEYIGLPVKMNLRADGYNFSSSGREDIDVRMLGIGRPFLLEVLNARQFSCAVNVALLQSLINKGTHLIKVRDLQVISKEDVKNLKDGEEAKTKSYSALCYAALSPENYENSKLDLMQRLGKLSKMTDLMIRQKTPLRVLHRRNLATRTRLIYSIETKVITQLNNDLEICPVPDLIPNHYIFFKLDMTTQAGTYIKEFVHGDFGRTVPNIRSLLEVNADILCLDVMAVNAEWPPSL